MVGHNHFVCHFILETFTEYPYVSPPYQKAGSDSLQKCRFLCSINPLFDDQNRCIGMEEHLACDTRIKQTSKNVASVV